MKPHPEKIYQSVAFRCVEFVRPHLRLIMGAALMGIGKFTLPLAFPLAFKYVVDVLVSPQPKLDGFNLIIDRWCAQLAHMMRLGATPESRLAALSIAMLALYSIQSATSYY